MSLRSGNILVYFDLADTRKLCKQAQSSVGNRSKRSSKKRSKSVQSVLFLSFRLFSLDFDTNEMGERKLKEEKYSARWVARHRSIQLITYWPTYSASRIHRLNCSRTPLVRSFVFSLSLPPFRSPSICTLTYVQTYRISITCCRKKMTYAYVHLCILVCVVPLKTPLTIGSMLNVFFSLCII